MPRCQPLPASALALGDAARVLQAPDLPVGAWPESQAMSLCAAQHSGVLRGEKATSALRRQGCVMGCMGMAHRQPTRGILAETCSM